MNLKRLKQIRDQKMNDARLFNGNMSVGGDDFVDEYDEKNPFYNSRNDKRGKRGSRPAKMRDREDEEFYK